MKKVPGYFIIILLIVSDSCRKDKNIDRLSIIPSEVKDFALFQPGTYWIYQDSASGVIDSVYVYDLITGIDSTSSGNFEYFDEYCTHSNGYSDHIWVNMSWSINYHYTPVWKSYFKPGDFIGQSYLMLYPFNTNRQYGAYTDYGTITIIGFLNNFNVLGNNYNEVICFHNTENIIEYHSESNYYVVKNFGLIRKELVDSLKIWNLVRCHIIQ